METKAERVSKLKSKLIQLAASLLVRGMDFRNGKEAYLFEACVKALYNQVPNTYENHAEIREIAFRSAIRDVLLTF